MSRARFRYTLLDVFTDVPLTGNQLAVVDDADGIGDDLMKAFARETRLAETTFVQSATEAGADYRNRIFCMMGEMPFAGHPSLGTAVAVARWRNVSGAASYVQQTAAGLHPIDVEIDGDRLTASMLQGPREFGPVLDPAPLLKALGLASADAHPDLPPQIVATGLRHLVFPLSSRDAVGRIKADPGAVDEVHAEHNTFGLYAAWCEPEQGAARVRMFGRSEQVLEDPATGSAAGPLCAYLNERAGITSVDITQGVEIGRASRLQAVISGETVRVGGSVVAVADGTVYL